jgi:MFS transporter, ACDE family, multidrug resistance protein
MMEGARPLIFTVTLVGVAANPLIAPSLPEVVQELAAPAWTTGAIIAAVVLPSVLVAPLLGRLGDRWGRRGVLVASLVLYGGAGVVSAAAPTWELLLLARLLQGIGGAGPVALAIVLIGDHFEGRERILVLGQNAAVLTGALAVLPAVSGALAGLGSWRTPLWGFGLAWVVAAWAARSPVTDVPLGSPTLERRGIRNQLAQRRFRGSLQVSMLFFALLFGVLLTIVPVLADQEFGLSPAARGLLLGCPPAITSLVSLQAGRIAARVRGGVIVCGAAVALSAGLAITGLAPWLGVLVAGVVVLGAAEGAAIPQLQRVATESGGEQGRSLAVALFLAAARLGQSTGPLAAGLLLGALAPRSAVAVFFVASFGLVAVSLPGIRRGPPSGPRPAGEVGSGPPLRPEPR